jgi:hypothetical protein
MAAILILSALLYERFTISHDPFLSAPPLTGSVIVTTYPEAACTISLDGQAKGLLSPGKTFSLSNIAMGMHSLVIYCHGFKPYTFLIIVNPEKVAFVEAILEKEK